MADSLGRELDLLTTGEAAGRIEWSLSPGRERLRRQAAEEGDGGGGRRGGDLEEPFVTTEKKENGFDFFVREFRRRLSRHELATPKGGRGQCHSRGGGI